jgi:hypothetical protein
MSDFLLRAVVIGAGATAVLDAWSLAQHRLLGAPLPDYGLVGRWFRYMPRGRFRHARIAAAAPLAGERAAGWIAHYGVGIAFAALLLAVCGTGWARSPTLLPAVLFGVVTVAAPFLVMQPAMGLGIAAARTPKPWAARRRSLVTHAVFGVGLYLAAAAAAGLGLGA